MTRSVSKQLATCLCWHSYWHGLAWRNSIISLLKRKKNCVTVLMLFLIPLNRLLTLHINIRTPDLPTGPRINPFQPLQINLTDLMFTFKKLFNYSPPVISLLSFVWWGYQWLRYTRLSLHVKGLWLKGSIPYLIGSDSSQHGEDVTKVL